MKKLIKKLLKESLLLPSFRLPKNVSISNEDKKIIQQIKWEDLKINDLGGSGKIAHLSVDLPVENIPSDSIVIDIQLIEDKIYQMHIHLPENLRGLGLGYKIYKAVIHDLGHLYSGVGRRLNPMVTKIWDKLKKDSDFECVSNTIGDLCMIKNHPEKEELKQFIVS